MYKQQLDEMPEHIQQDMVSLDLIGLTSYAWPVSRAMKIVDELDGWVILGGDLYEVRENGDIVPMIENWYYEPSGDSNDPQRSLEAAREYLADVQSWRGSREIIVDIVAEKR